MFSKRKASMLTAIMAVAIAVLVIVVSNVTFDGFINGTVQNLIDYRFGHVIITDKDENIERPEQELIGFLKNTGMVQGATVRLTDIASINNTRTAIPVRTYDVPVVGILPEEEKDATLLKDTILHGTYLTLPDTIILGSTVARDLDARIGDPLILKVTDKFGQEQTKRFYVVGISKTVGDFGFNTSVIVNIKTLRDTTGRDGESSELIVKLFNEADSDRISRIFSTRYAGENFKVETSQEAGESYIDAHRSLQAYINVMGYFGMFASLFGIITIMFMIVTSKTREIGILRAMGSSKIDVMIIFLVQGFIIAAIGAAIGFLLGSSFALYAQYENLIIGESFALAVIYDPFLVADIALIGMAMGVAASAYPAWRTTKLEPAEATRY